MTAPTKDLELEYRALQLIEGHRLRLMEVDWRARIVTALVTGSDGATVYRVTRRSNRWQCSCAAKSFGIRCKHIAAAQAVT
jgi:uncharacterized Zn finger protein